MIISITITFVMITFIMIMKVIITKVIVYALSSEHATSLLALFTLAPSGFFGGNV